VTDYLIVMLIVVMIITNFVFLINIKMNEKTCEDIKDVIEKLHELDL